MINSVSKQRSASDWGMCVGPRKAMMDVLGSDEDALEAALGLGELAGLTVTNEADAYDVSSAV